MTNYLRTHLACNFLLLFVQGFQCPLNSTINTATTKTTLCKDVITLLDGTSFRFNCGTSDDQNGLNEKCDPPSKKLIQFCPVSSVSRNKYFLTMCNSSLLQSKKDVLADISYSTASSFDLSSVDITSNCSYDTSNPVLLSNNSALIKSPEWPFSYRSGDVPLRNCRWKIEIPSKRKIKLFYMYLDLGHNNRCMQHTSSGDNIDSLLVQGWKDNTVVDTQTYCGYNPAFTKYYSHKLDSLSLQLTVDTAGNAADGSNGTGFVIGVVVVADEWTYKSWLEQYWWIFPIMLLICIVIGNCLWKKINHSHHKHKKERERGFNSSLNSLPTSITSQRHPSIAQQRGITTGNVGMDNLGQSADVQAVATKPPVTTRISFAVEVDVFG